MMTSTNDAHEIELDEAEEGMISKRPGAQSSAASSGFTIPGLGVFVPLPTVMGRPLLGEFKNNLKSGVTVSLIGVPLSISLALASQSDPVNGPITAIWAGGIAAALGGSHFNIQGPTGALSGILAEQSLLHGREILSVLAVLNGLLTLLVWWLGWYSYVQFLPSAVVHGFTVGVGFIIALNQLNFIFGITPHESHPEFLLNVKQTLSQLGETNGWHIFLFVPTFVIFYVMTKKKPKIPWYLLVSLFGILLGFLTDIDAIPITLGTLKTRYGTLKAELIDFGQYKGWSKVASPDFFDVLVGSFSVAFVAVLETLISAKIAQGFTNIPYDDGREVLATGLGNVFSGLAGGIPATAALARTALNIKSGATSRISGVINALASLFIFMVFFPLFSYLPLAIVGSMLVNVAVKMVEVHVLKKMWRCDRSAFVLTMITATICVVEDPTFGLVIGAVLGLLRHAADTSSGSVELFAMRAAAGAKLSEEDIKRTEVEHAPGSHVKADEEAFFEAQYTIKIYRVNGKLSYINTEQHVKRLGLLKEKCVLLFSLRQCWYCDLDGADTIFSIAQDLKRIGAQMYITGVKPEVEAVLSKHDWFNTFVSENRVFPTERQCLAYLDLLPHTLAPVPTSSAAAQVDEAQL
eukprot:TRINITY_DN1044_c0_g1_i1.p1 TRINITY_DN1044_c0_g1~~TRINITY_DN1044_c0_g1_i1.p1  ORF type:complete len:635 (+),score=183.01 TRINITY_DN1044_c0_g1_i1:46-1950(+)